MTRESIFISDATPEDNGFVRWLGARLELAGFSVWHDLGRLKGGDHFWDKIEGAMADVLALTKLNYNACIFGDGVPVTLRFDDALGEILTAAPRKNELPPLPFRYYI